MEFRDGKYFFVSDVHLGLQSDIGNTREKAFVDFLDSLPKDTAGLFLLGDIFDFWVEYKDAIPPGFDAVLERFRKLVNNGCRVLFFRGNHDYWTLDFFERELGMEIVDEPCLTVSINSLSVCVGHGDVLGRKTLGERIIFSLFRNDFLIGILRSLPRNWISSFGHRWSAASRKNNDGFHFDLKSSSIKEYAERKGNAEGQDIFIFGHFHSASSMRLECGSKFYILGDWSKGASYLNLSGTTISGLGFPNTVL